jgi:hypothetical protein
MAQETNGAWLALGVAGAVAAAGAVMGGRGSRAGGFSERFIGPGRMSLWAIQIPGLDHRDLTSESNFHYRRKVDAERAVKDWRESGVKRALIDTKGLNGEEQLLQLRRWLNMVRPSEYYAEWDSYADDTKPIFYKP